MAENTQPEPQESGPVAGPIQIEILASLNQVEMTTRYVQRRDSDPSPMTYSEFQDFVLAELAGLKDACALLAAHVDALMASRGG